MHQLPRGSHGQQPRMPNPEGNKTMKIVQHNLNRQREALFSLFETCKEKEVDVILLQEPYTPKINNQHIFIQHPNFYTIPPSRGSMVLRPRVLVYIRRNTPFQINPRYDLTEDLDMQIIEVEGEEPFL